MLSENITTESLVGGEWIALGALEITSVPHISIIGNGKEDINLVIEKYKNETKSLLLELFQEFIW